MNYQKLTGAILITNSLFVIGVWVILFKVASPVYLSWTENISNILSPESGMQSIFYASVASVIVSIACGVVYFSNLSKNKVVLLFLLSICTIQALLVFKFLDWQWKIQYIIPAILGLMAYKYPNKKFKLIP